MTLRAPLPPRAAAIAGHALSAAAAARIAVWNARARDPRAAQTATLRSLCRAAADTAFGREHRLGSVREYEDFRARVPLRSYAEIAPYLRRMRDGEASVLWPGLVPYFAETTGTTSAAGAWKHLPVSREQIRWQTRAAFDVLARYLAISGERALPGGYSLGIVPPVAIRREGKVGVCSNPGLLMHEAPRMSRTFSLPRPPVDGITDFDARLRALAASYLDHDVRLVAGTACWFPVFFDRVVEAARDRGRRADTVRDVWPNLRGLISGGVRPGPYLPMLHARLGALPTLVDHYNSTEAGVVACADRPGAGDMLVLPDRGTFYEFVPLGDDGRPGERRVPLWEVEPGVAYAVALCNASGLFGYMLGDVVRFTATFPHRLAVEGRLQCGLSPTHELTTEAALEAAVHFAVARAGVDLTEFAAAAEVGVDGRTQARYVLYAEFERAPGDLAAFAADVDAELCRRNAIYAFHRSGDTLLLAPRVTPLARGASQRFMDALGPRSVQQKFPRVLDDRRRALMEAVGTPAGTA